MDVGSNMKHGVFVEKIIEITKLPKLMQIIFIYFYLRSKSLSTSV